MARNSSLFIDPGYVRCAPRSSNLVPMAIATATSLDAYVGGKLLFEDVGFKLEPRERMTLSGRNGAGKSTLLRVLAGELAPESGSLSVQRGARVALHDQRPPRDSQATLGEYVFSGRTDMLETET